MISDEVNKILMELELKHGAGVVRRGAQQYLLRRTYAGEVVGKRRKISWSKKKDLYARQGGRCLACYQPFKITELEVDEMIPVSRGGETVKSNVRLLCQPCNRSKSNNTPAQEAKRTGVTILEQVTRQMGITLDAAEVNEPGFGEREQ